MLTPQQIREIRKTLGMTTPQFAEACGVSHYTVERWEFGDRHPRYKTLEKLNELAGRAQKKGLILSA